MDRLEIALELIREAIDEKKRLEIYNKEYSKLPGYRDPNFREARDKFYAKYPTSPKKSIINDNIKMARRLLLGEYVKGE